MANTGDIETTISIIKLVEQQKQPTKCSLESQKPYHCIWSFCTDPVYKDGYCWDHYAYEHYTSK